MTHPGTVYLVGAGPGDPGLITVRGLNILRTADAVVYDRLASESLLKEAKDGAELIDAGKRRGDHRMSQEEINSELVRLSSEGRSVCRLKGGDPFVFGRGGEEALALAEAGLPWEVVPGITSPIAAAAYAGIPITQRGMAASFTVVTGSEDPDKPDSTLDWGALARVGGTLAFVMGWKSMPQIVSTLIGNGISPETPAALVQWGTTPMQRTVTGSIEDIVEKGKAAGIGAPVILVVGKVSSLRDRLAWFDTRPLFGLSVLITRARSQASRLAEQLESHGARTIQVPVIDIVPVADTAELDTAAKSLDRYDWVTFTSANAVDGLWRSVRAAGLDGRAFGGVKIAVVGPATSHALEEIGLSADMVPEMFDADALLDSFRALNPLPNRVLFPRSAIGRESLVTGLRELGVAVDSVVAYETHMAETSGDQARAAYMGGVDVTTFTSSSSVENLVKLLGGDVTAVNQSTVACIGPVTAEAARANGIEVDLMARTQTIDGLVEAIVTAALAGTLPGARL
ncbi:MAG: uroporphyrinogen-III C-methyltransferase [Chloroflexi bacterium]|nr:uroporphyrinogen-III C-methyltransferase [Chloroflexota bacterium]